jgi:hypothetical protein
MSAFVLTVAHKLIIYGKLRIQGAATTNTRINVRIRPTNLPPKNEERIKKEQERRRRRKTLVVVVLFFWS